MTTERHELSKIEKPEKPKKKQEKPKIKQCKKTDDVVSIWDKKYGSCASSEWKRFSQRPKLQGEVDDRTVSHRVVDVLSLSRHVFFVLAQTLCCELTESVSSSNGIGKRNDMMEDVVCLNGKRFGTLFTLTLHPRTG